MSMGAIANGDEIATITAGVRHASLLFLHSTSYTNGTDACDTLPAGGNGGIHAHSNACNFPGFCGSCLNSLLWYLESCICIWRRQIANGHFCVVEECCSS